LNNWIQFGMEDIPIRPLCSSEFHENICRKFIFTKGNKWNFVCMFYLLYDLYNMCRICLRKVYLLIARFMKIVAVKTVFIEECKWNFVCIFLPLIWLYNIQQMMTYKSILTVSLLKIPSGKTMPVWCTWMKMQLRIHGEKVLHVTVENAWCCLCNTYVRTWRNAQLATLGVQWGCNRGLLCNAWKVRECHAAFYAIL